MLDAIESGKIGISVHVGAWADDMRDINGQIQKMVEIKAELLRLAKIGQQMQWVACRDRLPEHGKPIDVWIVEEGYGRRSIDAEYDADERLFNTDEGDYEADDGTEIDGIVTHWMVKPADPEILQPLLEGEK